MKVESMLKEFAQEKEISPTTELVIDLGIDGDDADELFENISKEFKIDLRRFQQRRYFHSEGELIDFWYGFKWLAHKLKFTKKPPLRALESFTAADLESLINVPNTNC